MTTRQPRAPTEHRITRRGALRAGGLGGVAVLRGAAKQGTAAQGATPAAGHQTGSSRPLLSGNRIWEVFGNRALVLVTDRGADFGECVATVQRIGTGAVNTLYRE